MKLLDELHPSKPLRVDDRDQDPERESPARSSCLFVYLRGFLLTNDASEIRKGAMNTKLPRRSPVRAACLLSIALLASPGAAIVSQAERPQARAQVIVLGVYHFANPNLDYVKTNVDDHLSEKRHKEIAEVVAALSRFKPTKIVLEAVEGLSSIHRNYEAYLKGEYALKVDERDQLGFRLAKLLGHKRVYAADNKLDMDFESVMAAAQQSGDQEFLGMFQKIMAELQEFEKRKGTMTVREILAAMNETSSIKRGGDLYLQISRVRSGDKFIGADVLAAWYQRNFRIFANLMRVIESPDDRVLVIFGAGHSAILRELVQSSPGLQLIEPNDYLTKP